MVGGELKDSETDGTGEMVSELLEVGELKESGTDGTREMLSE